MAVELSLDVIDLVLLRWLVDFAASGRMKRHEEIGQVYHWVHYRSVIQALPCLGITTKQGIALRLTKLTEARVLCRTMRGQRAYYGVVGPVYGRLVADGNRQAQLAVEPKPSTPIDGPSSAVDGTVKRSSRKHSGTIDSSTRLTNNRAPAIEGGASNPLEGLPELPASVSRFLRIEPDDNGCQRQREGALAPEAAAQTLVWLREWSGVGDDVRSRHPAITPPIGRLLAKWDKSLSAGHRPKSHPVNYLLAILTRHVLPEWKRDCAEAEEGERARREVEEARERMADPEAVRAQRHVIEAIRQKLEGPVPAQAELFGTEAQRA